MRISRLKKSSQPKTWPKVLNRRPFQSAMTTVETLDKKQTIEDNSQALIALSKTATEYRAWIEELEKAEDESRNKAEKKRQKGIANARNQLRELQKRQGAISKQLDRADIQEPKNLSDNWPASRMKQNQNLRGTKRLEAQLRAVAPTASERIKYAVKSMSFTLNAGNKKEFTQAEEASDLASRLLRQAQNAARKAQRSKGRRGRRRRVTGDRYYGQSVVGGDLEIKREYQVDKRYREEILDELQNSINDSDESGSREDKRVLENYLRQIIR